MAEYKSTIITDKKVWEGFLLSKQPKTFLQSWNWGEVNRKMGARIFRLGFIKNGKLVGICLVIKENARRGPHLIVPAGPILDYGDMALMKCFVEAIQKLGIKEKAWFVRVRPEILDTEFSRKLFGKLGFNPAPMHLHAENTWELGIESGEEQILKGMRKSTRYLVKKSLKEGLKTEISSDGSRSRLLFELQTETAERHHFVGFPQELFRNEIEIFAKDDSASVFVVSKGKDPLAAAIIIFYGDSAYYHFSGSVTAKSKVPFSYFLQWQVIKEAKRRRLKYYNFWGVAPNDDPNHRFAGVTLFKTGFGGQRIDWLHAQDLQLSPLYRLTYIFETIRKQLRHL